MNAVAVGVRVDSIGQILFVERIIHIPVGKPVRQIVVPQNLEHVLRVAVHLVWAVSIDPHAAIVVWRHAEGPHRLVLQLDVTDTCRALGSCGSRLRFAPLLCGLFGANFLAAVVVKVEQFSILNCILDRGQIDAGFRLRVTLEQCLMERVAINEMRARNAALAVFVHLHLDPGIVWV